RANGQRRRSNVDRIPIRKIADVGVRGDIDEHETEDASRARTAELGPPPNQDALRRATCQSHDGTEKRKGSEPCGAATIARTAHGERFYQAAGLTAPPRDALLGPVLRRSHDRHRTMTALVALVLASSPSGAWGEPAPPEQED